VVGAFARGQPDSCPTQLDDSLKEFYLPRCTGS
jgi:hypothetical protein